MIQTKIRKARKRHFCESGCGGLIERGELYRSSVASPGGDLGLEHWWRIKECGRCAERYGRPIVAEVSP